MIIPSPEQPSRVWHVSPLVDVVAYHLSWAWLLGPLLLVGDDRRRDYPFWFALVLGVNFAHRHYGLPYAYLDAGVRRSHRAGLTYVPAALLALFLLSPALMVWTLGRSVVEAMVFLAVVWNLWHTPMQKFGILRLYMAKLDAPLERKTPPWVDRLLVLAWIPFLLTVLGPGRREFVLAEAPSVARFLGPVLAFVGRHQPGLLVLSAALLVFTLVAFGYHDWRAHRWRNPARLSMALGTNLLFASFLLAHPVKVYLAFAFSHAVEYMVFVWAYQRRRYRDLTSAPPLLGSLLRSPFLSYALFTLLLAGVAVVEHLAHRGVLVSTPVTFLGLPGRKWFFLYGAYGSMVHFHLDGFLWKMRDPAIKAAV